MNTPTKTKKILLRSECERPPREIRDNHKLRTPWLRAKLDEINAKPGREAKVVGKGSYQEIRVYEVKEVEGRIRFRGCCQYCGHSQVVKNGVLVLHGYTRPGDGYVFGECPGMGKKPLNFQDCFTSAWLDEAILAEGKARIELEKAVIQEQLSYEAQKNIIADASPKKGWQSWNKPIDEQREAYAKAYALWKEKFPLTAAYYEARAKKVSLQNSIWGWEASVRHFQYLLDSKIFVTALEEEVVA